MNIAIPELALVVLIGPSGSGKSTFASAHFLPTETLSSDGCRALVSDDYNNQEATRDAFDILHAIASKRLERGRLTVIDATNVQKEARAPLIALARRYHCLPVAIVFDLPERICQARNAARPDRSFGPHVVRRHRADMRRSLKGLAREGFRHVFVLTSEAEVNAVKLSRVPLWNDRKSEHGPFDIIGDVHGCGDELEQLLAVLGYVASSSVDVYGGSTPLYSHPDGRKAVFLGDLNDRGPRVLDTMRIVKAMVDSGSGICLPGNHDVKLMRKLRGRNVQITHGLDVTLADIEKVSAGVRAAVEREIADFIDGLVSHFVFDDGKLVVAHAGMIESMQGRGSGGVREFALYGETTGETDEFGLPVRYNWAADYRGRARVVYGHTPVPTPEWLNGTINIDTGCVFGGALTALRYPEDELVRVEAHAVYADPVRPFVPQPPSEADFSAQQQHDSALDVSDVLGKRLVETRLAGNVTVREENATAALEVMSRFAVDPRWLVYLPPTMSPSESSSRPDVLEHPDEAFTYYAKEGVRRVVCEEKHMGSRAVIVVCRDEETARRRFGVEGCGMIYTRTGRPMFEDRELSEQLLSRARTATSAAGLWDELNTDWLVLDCELMPWSAKAQGLLKNQYAAVGAAARAALTQTIESLEATSPRLPDAAPLLETARERQTMTEKYVEAYRHYCWTVSSINDYKIAPFHLLASEGKVHVDRSHAWHMDTLARLARNDEDLFLATPYRIVDLESHESFPKRLANAAAANRASDRQVPASRPAGNDGEVVAALDAATDLHGGSLTTVEPELHPGSQTNAEPEAHPGQQTKAEPEPHPGSQTNAATNLHPGSQTNAESELHPGSQTNAATNIRPGSQTNAESELHPGSQTNAEPELRHGSQTNSEPHIHAPGSRPRDSFTLSASERAVIPDSEAATTIMADQDLRGPITPEAATEWWSELTNRGGEGMVVKPLEFLAQGRRGVVQPALKCRGPEYLRIIYGPEYLEPANLDRLQKRSVRVKRSLAFREFALGLEALERFVRKEPLRRIHECVFAVLALESEPVDPRL